MATEKSFQLYINKDNVKHYFTASGGVLNGAQISTKYITMRTSSTTATFTMNNAGRDVLFPSAAAIAHKVDVWAQAIATLNSNKNTINVAIAGQNAITTERIHTSLTEYTGSVSGSFTKSNTSAVYVIKILNVFHAAGVRDTSITAYFTQYSCAVNKSGNGVKNVSVSNAEPYEGETVTFSAELYNGANFDGWYSDEACTQLVSSNLTYSTTAADLTLYAKATIDANLYNVSAVAGSEITSVSVSDSIVPDGSTATFTAQVNGGCSFEAWYSDNTYTTVVSTENPYTATITADTTLYAKAHISSLNISVGTAEHGTASVSATTVLYGDDVTFTFTPEDETWELYGWYSDLALTQLVSEANPYTFTATEDVTLYPKVGRIRYKITFKTVRNATAADMKVAVLDFDALTRAEKKHLKIGNYEAITQSKVFDIKSASISSLFGKILTVEILCPLGMTAAFWGRNNGSSSETPICFIDDANNNALTSWPYYWYQPSKDATFKLDEAGVPCVCSAIAKEGVSYADATTPTRQGYNAIFEAEVTSGYTFSGWYSDEDCTTLVSTDNPAHVTTPTYTTENPSRTSLTLYAKAVKATYTIRVGTADHCTTSVSAATAQYGDTVTFNCMVNEGYEFNGWYSDEGLTQLVSESAEYVHSVTGNIMLYPKVGIKRYTATIKMPKNPASVTITVKIVALQYDQLTKLERRQLKIGNFEQIDQSKIIAIDSDSGAPITREISASVKVPINSTIAIWAKWDNQSPKEVVYIADKNYIWISNYVSNLVSPYNYYTFVLQKDEEYRVGDTNIPCHCSAVAMDGIEYASVITPTVQGYNAVFEADLIKGYEFAGWYSDEACTQLISTDNPAQVKTPSTGELGTETSLTLYAKATPLSSTTDIYFKCNGSWIKAKSVFKKTNGAWVEQEDLSAIFSGESSGTASNYVYGGSV